MAARAWRQAEAGTPVVEICRKMEITETTFYRWKQKYVGSAHVMRPTSNDAF